MEKLLDFLNNILFLANSMSIYILIGLLIAGLLKELLPNDFVSSHLGKGGTASVVKATLFGIPMPVCSCSVIPLAKSLQKEGASKGAVQSFLISTPITGADSILATASFFGWFFTLYRVVTSIIIAITAGILQNIFDKKEEKKKSI
ncbi:MAG TPA: permease, partial [Nitratifractor sp.]|nr:permease [Nitratifractor sp.]